MGSARGGGGGRWARARRGGGRARRWREGAGIGGRAGPGEEEGVGDVRGEQALGEEDRRGEVVVVFEGNEVAHLPMPIGLMLRRCGAVVRSIRPIAV